MLQDLDDGVEATIGQLSGALTRIRDAAQVTASAPAPEVEADLVSTQAEAQSPEADDPAPVTEEATEPDAPIEDAEPVDPPGEDDDAASYEDDWYRFLKHTQGPEAT